MSYSRSGKEDYEWEEECIRREQKLWQASIRSQTFLPTSKPVAHKGNNRLQH